MHFPKVRLASTGSLVLKVLGVDEGETGLVLLVDESKKGLPGYVVFTQGGKVTSWMTCFVDIISEI